MVLSDQTLNDGLELHLEFGKNWLTDISKRLSKKHPDLSKSDLEKADKLCRKIARNANDFISRNPIKNGEKVTLLNYSDFKVYILNQYSWINKENLSRLYNQSCYYAMK